MGSDRIGVEEAESSDGGRVCACVGMCNSHRVADDVVGPDRDMRTLLNFPDGSYRKRLTIKLGFAYI